MTKDEKVEAAVICGWGAVCILLVVFVLMGVKFVCTKTYNAYTSWKDRPVVVKVDTPKKITPKIVTPKKSVDKKAKRLAKLRKSPSWDDEFGNLMYRSDGSLRDPSPDDGYTASQNYWILAWCLLALFLWIGFATGTLLGAIVSIVGYIILFILGFIMWQW